MPGDIFEVCLRDGTKKYFQFIYKDIYNLGGNLIRGYNYINTDNSILVMDKDFHELIVPSGIAFYAYTGVKTGVQRGLFNFIGKSKIEEDFELPAFRNCGNIDPIPEKSFKWYKKKGDKNTFIGELKDEYKSAPYEWIFPPSEIVIHLELGRDPTKYPE